MQVKIHDGNVDGSVQTLCAAVVCVHDACTRLQQELATSEDRVAMRPFDRLLWTLVIIIISEVSE